jgi:hypothetical protein
MSIQSPAESLRIALNERWERYGNEMRAVARDGRGQVLGVHVSGGLVHAYVPGGVVHAGIEVGKFTCPPGQDRMVPAFARYADLA